MTGLSGRNESIKKMKKGSCPWGSLLHGKHAQNTVHVRGGEVLAKLWKVYFGPNSWPTFVEPHAGLFRPRR